MMLICLLVGLGSLALILWMVVVALRGSRADEPTPEGSDVPADGVDAGAARPAEQQGEHADQ